MSEPSNTPEVLSTDLPDFIGENDFELRGFEPNDIYAVLLYELARHVPTLVEGVTENRELLSRLSMTKPMPRFGEGMRARPVPQDGELDRAFATQSIKVIPPEGPLELVDSAVLTFLVCSGGFPESGWLELTVDQMAAKLWIYPNINAAAIIDLSHLLKPDDAEREEYSTSQSPGKLFEDFARNHAFALGEEEHLHAFAVDWRKSNKAIMNSFEEILKRIRPNEMPHPTGYDANILAGLHKLGMAPETALARLGVWRQKNHQNITWGELFDQRSDAHSEAPEVLKANVNETIRKLRKVALEIFPSYD